MAQDGKDQKKQDVIDVLNKARSLELQAITQYMMQHYALANMDYGEMAANLKLIAVDEMRHAEMFAERILELGGEATTAPAGKVEIGQKVQAIFPFDAQTENNAIEAYNQFLLLCRENNDSTSSGLFATIIEEEQMHFRHFDSVGKHIEKLGETYLAKIAGTPSATGLQTLGFVGRQGNVPPQGGA